MPRRSPVADDDQVQDEPDEFREIDPRICQGPCTAKLRETGKGGGGIVRYGDPVLCQPCVSRLRGELDGLDARVTFLLNEADGHRGSTGADAAIRAHRNAGTRGSASPAYDLVNELIGVLRKWVIVKRQTAWRLGYIARDVTELAAWLKENLNWYTDDRAVAGEFADEIHRWHLRLNKRAKATPVLHAKPIPCPSCRKMGLEQEEGSPVVKCRECGLIQPAEVYESDVADAAEATQSAAEDAAQKPSARRAG